MHSVKLQSTTSFSEAVNDSQLSIFDTCQVRHSVHLHGSRFNNMKASKILASVRRRLKAPLAFHPPFESQNERRNPSKSTQNTFLQQVHSIQASKCATCAAPSADSPDSKPDSSTKTMAWNPLTLTALEPSHLLRSMRLHDGSHGSDLRHHKKLAHLNCQCDPAHIEPCHCLATGVRVPFDWY
jgi:hypothetical protein